MATKNNSHKDIIKELKGFNKDLEKHIPGINTDFLQGESIFNQDPNKADYLRLFGENILDLRTEIALMRKNLSVDVEGMVLRIVKNQQDDFEERMNNFFVKSVIETKKSWERHVGDFSHEMSIMKKTTNNIKIQNDSIEKNLRDLNKALILMNSKVDNVVDSSHLNNEIKKLSLELNSKFDTMSESTHITNEIKSLSERINANHLKHLKNLDQLKSIAMEKNSDQNNNNNNLLTNNSDNVPNNLVLEDKANEDNTTKTYVIDDEIQGESFMAEHIPLEKENTFVPKINRILEIDKKISKLNALR